MLFFVVVVDVFTFLLILIYLFNYLQIRMKGDVGAVKLV